MKALFKKLICLALAAAMTAGLAACGNNGAGKKQYNVAVLLPGSVAYYSATTKGNERAADEYGIKLTFFDAEWDSATQISQIEDCCMSGRYDMIALVPVDAMGVIPGLEYAQENNMPVMTWSNTLGDDINNNYPGIVAHVGQNDEDTGALCAKIVRDLLGEGGGNVVCIEGRAGTFAQVHRRIGFESGLEGSNVNIVYTKAADWDKYKAMQIAEDVLQSGTDIDAFFCQDDVMAAGVGSVVQEYGMQDKIKVVGMSGSIEGLKAMKEGLIQGDTFISAVELGYQAIATCGKYLSGQKYDTRLIMKQVEVTPDTVNDFTGEW